MPESDNFFQSELLRFSAEDFSPEEALEISQTWPVGLYRDLARGFALFRLEQWSHAEEYLTNYISHPVNDSGFISYKLAICAQARNQLSRALVALLLVLKIRLDSPKFSESLIQYGNICLELCMQPIFWLRLRAKLNSDISLLDDIQQAKIDYVEGLMNLFQGNYQRGWRLNYCRYQAGFSSKPSFQCPELQPHHLMDAKKIILYADGGFGDTVFSLRFVHQLRLLGHQVELICHSSLLELVSSTGLADGVYSKLDAIECDNKYWLNIIDLPYYLQCDGPRQEDLMSISIIRDPLWDCIGSSRDEKVPVVALNWGGSGQEENFYSPGLRGRSFFVRDLEHVLNLQRCNLISVQVGAASREIHESVLSKNLVCLQARFDQTPHSFLKTASVLLNVDLLITNDTSVAHLGGTLGVATWVILNDHAYWYWGQEEFTPWYPSVRCFRQQEPRDWTGVMASVDQALGQWLTDWNRRRETQGSLCL